VGEVAEPLAGSSLRRGDWMGGCGFVERAIALLQSFSKSSSFIFIKV
jgi:hypothetical protein